MFGNQVVDGFMVSRLFEGRCYCESFPRNRCRWNMRDHMWDVYSIEDVTTSTTATTVPTTSTTKTRTTKTRTTATKSTTTKTITTKTTTTTVVVRCGPGEYRYAYRNVCRECGYRQFQSEEDHTFEACHKWSGCDSHEYEFEKPNRTHNTLCASHSDCAAGVEYESRPPRPGKSDRQVRQEAAGRLLIITSAMHTLRWVAYPSQRLGRIAVDVVVRHLHAGND